MTITTVGDFCRDVNWKLVEEYAREELVLLLYPSSSYIITKASVLLPRDIKSLFWSLLYIFFTFRRLVGHHQYQCLAGL